MKAQCKSFIQICAFLCAISMMAFAQQTAPDNTKVNQRDRSKSAVTADHQLNNRSDLELTKQIRQALIKDKSLSTYAHNVKVIAQNGKVTLKGPVHSQEEKAAVEAKATEVAGASNVTSELEIKSKK